jgi:hypothetical protein
MFLNMLLRAADHLLLEETLRDVIGSPATWCARRGCWR